MVVSVSKRGKELNQLFLTEMTSGRTSTMAYVRDLWWSHYSSDVARLEAPRV
jgi:hypothetical protein